MIILSFGSKEQNSRRFYDFMSIVTPIPCSPLRTSFQAVNLAGLAFCNSRNWVMRHFCTRLKISSCIMQQKNDTKYEQVHMQWKGWGLYIFTENRVVTLDVLTVLINNKSLHVDRLTIIRLSIFFVLVYLVYLPQVYFFLDIMWISV